MATNRKTASSTAMRAKTADALIEALEAKAKLLGLDSEITADQNAFDKGAAFLRKLAEKLNAFRPGWILNMLFPDLRKVIDEVVDVLNTLADAIDKYGEDEG